MPDENEGVNQGFISASGSSWSIIGKITINNKMIITNAEVGLRKVELAKRVIHSNVVVTRNEKARDGISSNGKLLYL